MYITLATISDKVLFPDLFLPIIPEDVPSLIQKPVSFDSWNSSCENCGLTNSLLDSRLGVSDYDTKTLESFEV